MTKDCRFTKPENINIRHFALVETGSKEIFLMNAILTESNVFFDNRP